MSPAAILGGAMSIPVSLLNVAEVKKECTYRVRPMGADEDILIPGYEQTRDGFLHVPRQYGIGLCKRLQLDFADETAEGTEAEFPQWPDLRDYQREPVQSIMTAFESFYDVVFRARTAFGKTISSLWIAAQFGVTTIVLVDQENLRDQWVETLTKFFGFSIDDIGIVQGKQHSFRGKAVTIAMVQTLRAADLPDDFWGYFGFAILDEIHALGAPSYLPIHLRLAATKRLCVSATPVRRDGMQRALVNHFGRVRVAADAEHARSAVYIMRHDETYSWYANISPKIGRMITEVSEDGARNLKCAEAIMHLYSTGRDVLVLSDRISQLYEVSDMLYYMGIDAADMGIYTGQTYAWKVVKDPTPIGRPEGLVNGKDTEYTPVRIEIVQKKTPKAVLKDILENAPITFATYQMFQKGVDAPRLSGGIDLTPRSQASQVVGRIKRGKSTFLPIWVTVVDDTNYRNINSFASRLQQYHADKSDIYEWHDDGELTLCNYGELLGETYDQVKAKKGMRIQQTADGLNMLMTPQIVRAVNNKHAIARAAPRRSASRR